jgi:hypothetical protein
MFAALLLIFFKMVLNILGKNEFRSVIELLLSSIKCISGLAGVLAKKCSLGNRFM